MKGVILKGIGGFYTVLLEDGSSHVCRARGRFRHEDVTPLPGDRVEASIGKNEKENVIADILPRKNLMIRPTVANIDKLLIVLALTNPKPDLLLADKLIIQCEMNRIEPVIILNKADGSDGIYETELRAEYRSCSYDIITASARTGLGMERIKAHISGNTCCFAGQSAVGKTSILNALVPELAMEVGGLSKKTDRGRHTTRHAELWNVFGGAIVDTPGFSLMDNEVIEPWDLWKYYPEMVKVERNCRFSQCTHTAEPDCGVKELVENGVISRERYERYILLVNELKEKRKHRYD